MHENDFLRWIATNTPAHSRVPLGIGDDMAVVRVGGDEARSTKHETPNTKHETVGTFVLLKIDQCLDQVHFDLHHHSATQAGRKAVNRCLSDCAGMACLPTAIMISVALPRGGPGSGESFAKELFLACRDAAAAFDCPLVGGDTAIWDQRLALTVAALGTLPQGGREVRRSGARPGDTLFVSGTLGGSWLPGDNGGGRHLTFVPRIELAQTLAKALGPAFHALMDISDGLAQDLPRLCAASAVGAEVHTGNLPIHPDAQALAARDGIPAGLHALADGEDYELLFAVDPETVPNLVNISAVPLTAIGTVTTAHELVLIDESGKRHPWPRAGWEHH